MVDQVNNKVIYVTGRSYGKMHASIEPIIKEAQKIFPRQFNIVIDSAEDRKMAIKALERLSSGQGFEAIGVIPNDMWGDELKARMDYAKRCLDELTYKGSPPPKIDFLPPEGC